MGGCKSLEPGIGYERLAVRPPGDAVTAREVYPLRAGEWTYLVTAGDGVGGEVVRSRVGTDRFRASWADEQGDLRTEFWTLDDEGDIVMPAVIDHGDDAVTFFTPPLIIAYRVLEGDRRREHVVQMRVMDGTRRERQREGGTATRSVTYSGDHLLGTPLGELLTRRLDVTFTADLQMAEAETTVTLYVHPDYGIVVEERQEIVRALGVPVRNRVQTLVLVRTTNAPPPSPQSEP